MRGKDDLRIPKGIGDIQKGRGKGKVAPEQVALR